MQSRKLSSTNNTALTQNSTSSRTWLAVIALGVSAFSIVTSELAPVGMLSSLAADLHQTEAGTGRVVMAYGWVAAVAALLSGAIPTTISRKGLLVGLMLILALSCMAATHATTMNTFMSARMVGALAHGAFWALIGTVAAQLVPVEKLGLATSVVFGGVSAASVLGVPLSSLIADLSGWRTAFMAISMLSLATACALLWTLPGLKAPGTLSVSIYYRIVKNPILLSLYAATACIITAHFAAFTYLEPLLTKELSVPSTSVSLLLLVSGLSGLGGNIVAGKLIDLHLKKLIIGSLILSSLSMSVLGMPFIASLPVTMTGTLLAIWGAGIAIVFVGLQTWLLRSAADATQPASAIYVAIFNAAIGTGALVGGMLLSAVGLKEMVLVASGIILASVVLVIRLKESVR
ncbi:MFS transporter [Type-E symbiont of Plautia stali]|uniref:MFS transporter n=1 Tax=Type-E symbiont of Plautia stali TaxID=1560357 RepID=UPI00073E6B8A|nr:MFS transporter [Type-E symbiont of Plautia stali]